MLQIKEIRKEYRTGDLVQTALGGVSLALRDNEFVAILGPSGSGKTTLLNIIGGLDRYDSGDLIINDVSTRKYSDRDWDSYRNHTIGFVFQSYNLIPHQTVLSNVELALTISGVSRAEKRRRAVEALTKVGLGDQLHKRPNQMSGGQMQRVAIARALVNDPDILLADEPTGALDTQTSVQVMDLLKEVAKDRLVVMVTHNPELAEQYATRIVQLRDGQIISDSDPFEPEGEAKEAVHKNLGKASMSFFTALALSFNNLWTKRGRTILTAFAGSIGIIGIALILSLSTGADMYIKSIEEDTLSEYPITISSSGLDYGSVFSQMADARAENKEKEEEEKGDVRERHVVNTMFAGVSANDLKSFKLWLDSNSDRVDSLSTALQYNYSVTPQIYRLEGSSGYRQVHPDQTLSSLGVSYGSFSSFAMMDSNIFFALPQEKDLYLEQYKIDAGRWPEDYHECVLVLTGGNTISDLVLYSLGLKDAAELDEMIKKYNNGEDVSLDTAISTYKYEDFIGLEFSLVNASDYYEYDETYKVYVDKRDNQAYVRGLVENGEKLKIVGVVSPAGEDNSASMLSFGVGFPHELLEHTMELAASSNIAKAQLADPDTDVFTGKLFGEDAEEDPGFDLSSIFSIDEDKLRSAFSFDQNALNIDLSWLGNLDLSSITIDFSELDFSDLRDIDLAAIFKDIDIQVSQEELQKLIQAALDAYAAQTDIDPSADAAAYAQGFAQFLASEQGRTIISNGMDKVVNTEEVRQQLETAYNRLNRQVQPIVREQVGIIFDQVVSQLSDQLQTKMTQMMAQIGRNFQRAFKVDIDAFTGAININIDATQLQELMMSMMPSAKSSYEGNLSKLNYADKDNPNSILIYPKDFDSKTKLVAMIDEYNEAMKAAEENDKVITYTDYVATLMSSVTTIVNTISYVLIAFVAISLIVSSIMIGIITYISVLERTKEIGILRAIGASKRNVSQVFNAETFIIGLLSGLIGVGVSLLILIPGNALIHSLAGNNDISAVLPVTGAVALVIISVLLTLIGGLIPSRAAAKKDPVTALRTE